MLGPVRDKIGNRMTIILEMFLTVAAVALVLIVSETGKYNALDFLMCFVWGVMDAGINMLLNCILGFEFERKDTPFGVYKFSQSLFNCIFLFFQGQVIMAPRDNENTAEKIYFWWVLCCGAFGLLSMVILLVCFKYKE